MTAIEKIIRGYHLHEHLGVGGFGAVYRASQPSLKREVAIKVILPHLANEPEFIRRFEVEAELVARLEHPHIVPLFDYWREPDGAYLVMRYLRGGSLRDALDEGTLAQERIIEIMDQITQALHVAHRNGVVHRDIKPANILLDEDNNAYLTDFGIAKTNSADSDTDEGDNISGSLPYMSPEQIQSGEITPQTDIYSLGVMLYELFTGEHPFKAMSITDLLLLHIQEPLPDITLANASLTSEVNDVIQKATAKIASKRYADVRELVTDLRRVLSGQPVPEFSPEILLDVPNPYKGLRAFQSTDADQFFGRSALINQLLVRLGQDVADARFLALVGPSGSGKSSVVKAGLVPAFRQGKLAGAEKVFITEMMPGNHPFVELEASLIRVARNSTDSLLNLLQEEDGLLRTVKRILPDDDSELVLIIDQFEELFTLFDDDDKRQRFLNNLVSAVQDERSRMRIIVTLRADFYDKPLHYQPFAELFRNRVETVLPMTSGELAECIVEPARQVGIEFQAGLVDTIIKEVDNQPGMLPLLQYALTELFERRSGNRLTLEAYNDMGGVSGALAGRAESLYHRVNEDGQQAIRQMFLRLITPGEGTADTRRRVRYSDLPENVQDSGVLKRYGDYRLLTFDRDPETRQPTVEVAHEAILHEWLRLGDWLNESRDDIRTERLLASQVVEWQANNKSNDYLLRGTRLAQFVEWREQSDLALTEIQNTFLDTSLAEQQREEQLKQEQQEQQRKLEKRAQRFFQILAFVLFVMVLGAVGITVFALDRESRANEARDAARQAQGEAQELALVNAARASYAEEDFDTAISYALQVNQGEDVSAAAQAILADSAYHAGTMRLYETEQSTGRIEIHPDGMHMISAPLYGTEKLLWNIETGEIVQRYDSTAETNPPVMSVVFSPDGERVAFGHGASLVIVYDTFSGEEIARLQPEDIGDGFMTNDVEYTPQGEVIASYLNIDNTGQCTSQLVFWDIETGEIAHNDPEASNCIAYLEMTSDGTQLITGGSVEAGIFGSPGIISFWDVETGELVRRLGEDGDGHQGTVVTMAISPDGQTLVTAGADLQLIFWDVDSGEPVARIDTAFSNFTFITLDISSDGKMLSLTPNISGRQVALYDMRTFEEITAFDTYLRNILRATFMDDSRYLVIGGQDRNIRLLDLNYGAEITRFTIETPFDHFASYSPDFSKKLYTSTTDDFTYDLEEQLPVTHNIFSMETGELLDTFELDGVANARSSQFISADQVTTSLEDGTIIIWDAETGEELRRFSIPFEGYNIVDVYDNNLIMNVPFDRREPGKPILFVNIDDETVKQFGADDFAPVDVNITPDGQRLLAGSMTGTVVLWDVETEELLSITPLIPGLPALIGDIDDASETALIHNNNELLRWNIDTGEVEMRYPAGVSSTLFPAWFTPEGILFSGEENKLFDIETGEVLRTLPKGFIADYTPDKRIILNLADQRFLIAVLRLDSQSELIEWTQNNRYVRDLTCDERELYRLAPLCEADRESASRNSQ